MKNKMWLQLISNGKSAIEMKIIWSQVEGEQQQYRNNSKLGLPIAEFIDVDFSFI